MFRFVALTRFLRSLSAQGAVDNVEAVMVERASATAALDHLEARCVVAPVAASGSIAA
jgi:hypothetical protein